VPTLCMAAEHDQAAPAAVMARMASHIPHSESVRLPGLGHLMNLEDPAAFALVLFDFLEQHLP
jgi:pimeloyl-ACP methyl ester carboxylesterase